MSDEPTSAPVRLPDAYRRWRVSRLGQITDRLEEELILELIGPPAGLRILDVGCGDAALAVTLAQRGAHVTGVDVDPSMLAAGRARAASGVAPDLMQGDIRAQPFADDSFDLALAVTVLCFVDDAAPAVREMTRVVRPGGRLVIGELGPWSLWAAKRRIGGWLGSRLWRSTRFRTVRALNDFVADAGLTVTMVRGAVYYPPFAPLATLLARCDAWIGKHTTAGAAFLIVVGEKPA
ncbi:MAG: class I SAM-dependent methyltransferase [Vicinamibacterales bacterium]|jgi:SAM-dependent methyltransferase